MDEVPLKEEKPPSLQKKKAISDSVGQCNKPSIRDIYWIYTGRRGLLATGMVIAITDKFSGVEYPSLV